MSSNIMKSETIVRRIIRCCESVRKSAEERVERGGGGGDVLQPYILM